MRFIWRPPSVPAPVGSVTNNRADFLKSITEIDVTYPEDLPDAGSR